MVLLIGQENNTPNVPGFFFLSTKKTMDKKQTLKHSIESLLRLLENKEVVKTTDQNKVVLESCADAEMFPCDEETCEVPGNADLPNTFAMHEGKVVQCLPLDYLGVIKAKGEKRSILDRSTDVLRKLHEVAIPQMQKMLSHRQRMTCGAYDTRRNDDHDRGMCNAAVDLGGHRRCFWDPLADQRCQHSVKSLADELERLRVHMDNLSKAVQDGDFRDFVTGLVEKHKNEWRATFTQWQWIKVEFQERAFWFEKSLGKQEICRVHNRDQATCEGSGMCEFTDEGVCRVTPEEQKNGPVWVADQDGGTVPVVSDEFPHYLAGYRSIFREYRIDDEYEVGQTMERMQGGALALSLKLRREKLWTLEVKNGQKNYNELVQKSKQLEVASFSTSTDPDVIKMLQKGLQGALGNTGIDSLQTFRQNTMDKKHINDVMKIRNIRNSWEPPETETETEHTAPIDRQIEQVVLKHTNDLKQKIMEQAVHEQEHVRKELEEKKQLQTGCESNIELPGVGGDDDDCEYLQTEIKNLTQKEIALSKSIRTLQHEQYENASAIAMSKEKEQEEDDKYKDEYGPPPSVPVDEFKKASPWNNSRVTWEDNAIVLYKNTETPDASELLMTKRYHTCKLMLKLFNTYVVIVNHLKIENKIDAMIALLDLQKVRGKLAVLPDTEGLMTEEFGNPTERPKWLQKESTVLPPFYVKKNSGAYIAYELDQEKGEWTTHNIVDDREWKVAEIIWKRYTEEHGWFSFMSTNPPTVKEQERLKKKLDEYNIFFPTEFQGDHVAVEESLFKFRQQHTPVQTQPEGQLVALQPALMATKLSDTAPDQMWKGVVEDMTQVEGKKGRLVMITLTHRKDADSEDWVGVTKADPIFVDITSIQENYTHPKTYPPQTKDQVKVLTSVYVEQFVTPVRANSSDELVPWVSVQRKYPEKRTNEWFQAIGPYVNPNVSMYNKDKQLDTTFCEQLRTTEEWFDLYTSEVIEDHKRLLDLANRPHPDKFKNVGGWKPNSVWMHTLHGDGASAKNVYAHHLKPETKDSPSWMTRFFSSNKLFKETPFSQGTLVRRKNSNDVYMINSGIHIIESDMYKQLHLEDTVDPDLKIKSVEFNGTLYTNVPHYTCVSFTRRFEFCTAESVEGDGTVTFKCNGTVVNRNLKGIEVGETKYLPFYEKQGGDVQLSHLELEEVPEFKKGEHVLYTNSDSHQAHGTIESVTKELSLVTITGVKKVDGTPVFIGFEHLQQIKKEESFVFNVGHTVAIQTPIIKNIVGTRIEFSPRNNGYIETENQRYLTMFNVMNVNWNQQYRIVNKDYGDQIVDGKNLVFFESLTQTSNNPYYKPDFKKTDRVFLKKEAPIEDLKNLADTLTNDLAVQQWLETRDVEVVSVYPLKDENKLGDNLDAASVTFAGYRIKPLIPNILPFNVEEKYLTRVPPRELGKNDVVEVKQSGLWLTTWGTSGLFTKTVKVGVWEATVQYRRRGFPTCHDEAQRKIEITASETYFTNIDMLAQEYIALKKKQNTVQEHEDMFGDLEDVSVVHRKSFLAGGDGYRVRVTDIENEAKNLPRPSLARNACQTVPEYISPDEKNILFSVHQWGKDVFEPPLDVYNDKTYIVKREETDVSKEYPNLMMPTWNLVYSNWSFWDSNRVLFPQTSSDQSDWLQAGEMSKSKTRLIGRIEETQNDCYRVRFQCFPKGDWTNPSSCIIVSCWVKKEFLDRIDYAKEHYESRRYFASIWNDTSDVPSFAVAGWTDQQSDTLMLDGVPIPSPHTDPRVPWMLKTMAFQRPWNEQVRMVETVLRGTKWRNAFLKAILQFQQEKEVNELTWEGTAASALESWMKMARRVKDLNNRKEPDNVLFMKNGVPLDLDLVPSEWFYQDAYPMRKIFYELKD